MLRLFQTLLGAKPARAPAARFIETARNEIFVEGAAPFPIAQHISRDHDFPIVDWNAVHAWLATLDEARRNEAWTACEHTWLMRLGERLGLGFRLVESGSAVVLSTLEPDVAQASLDYVARTRSRIVRVLEGVARPVLLGKDILLVFDDEDTYYRYVSIYLADGEYATTGGMFIDEGCSHFVTTKADLRRVEPVIAHEMTHASVAHLPLPAWLNEGLAVNTEVRLCGRTSLYTAQELHDKQVAFWDQARVQAFWSGEAFYMPGDASMLAYDLARVMVELMARDWESFKPFALAARAADGGAAAAREHFGVDLGEYVCALVEKSPAPGWSPNPALWKQPG